MRGHRANQATQTCPLRHNPRELLGLHLSGQRKLSPQQYKRVVEMLQQEDKEKLDPETIPTPGYPRPFAEGPDNKKLPVPWATWMNSIANRDWLQFSEYAEEILEASNYQLCNVCGEELGDKKVFVKANKPEAGFGSAIHPKCALLTYHYCPHFANDKNKDGFLLYQGQGNGINLDNPQQEWLDRDNRVPDPSVFCLDPETKQISVDQLKELAKDERGQAKCPVNHD
jgi:hypothetical protein